MGASNPGQVIKVFAERFEAGDLDGLMELYEDDCLVPGPEGEIYRRASSRDFTDDSRAPLWATRLRT